MRRVFALSAALTAFALHGLSCGQDPLPSHMPKLARAEAKQQAPCHAQVELSAPWPAEGRQARALNLVLSADAEPGVRVPFKVTAKGPNAAGFLAIWNSVDDGSGPEGLKLVVRDEWESLLPNRGNELRLGGIFLFDGKGDVDEVAVNGVVCRLGQGPGPAEQDQPSKDQTATRTTPAPQPESKPVPTAAPAPAVASAPVGDEAALKETVRGYIVKLCNEPRSVPGDVTHQDEVRGGPGNFEKLSKEQVDELVAGIIYTAKLFTPAHLKIEERCALIAVDISAESGFRIGTAGLNPNPSYGNSVNVMQVTPSIYVPMFQKRAQIDGLRHYDGSPWKPTDTTEQMMIDSIWDSMVVSAWGMSEQGKSGAGNPRAAEFGEDVGQCPKTWETSLLCWVCGYPAIRKGPGDAAYDAQAFHYINMQTADLALLGFPSSLLAAEF